VPVPMGVVVRLVAVATGVLAAVPCLLQPVELGERLDLLAGAAALGVVDAREVIFQGGGPRIVGIDEGEEGQRTIGL